jgi:pilus assembly protein CpaB
MARLPVPSNVIYIGLALVLAIVTSILFNNAINGSKDDVSNAPEPIKTSEIVVASQNILPGQRIMMADIKTVEWPETARLDDDSIYHQLDDVLNNVAKVSIVPNEPILKHKLVGESSRGGLPVVIPKGKRAVTVAVSETIGVGGFLRPGDWVDVLTTINDAESGEITQLTKTVIQNVQVLATAQSMTQTTVTPVDNSEESAEDQLDNALDGLEEGEGSIVSSITLALSPEETEKVVLADEIGSIRLVLRGEIDKEQALVNGIDRNRLLSGTRRRAAPAPTVTTSTSTPRRAPVTHRKKVEFYDGADKQVLGF